MSAPKVFVSHASEDKDRFVVEFVRRLRENGVDAWLDLIWSPENGRHEVWYFDRMEVL
ncbi:MAG: toll/interleukin-1 receptor domain-containing protein [Burkholderiales bacterium]|nr:toll/interleukin-1 receptor domain-containing protein [Burkholderiales bacterium]